MTSKNILQILSFTFISFAAFQNCSKNTYVLKNTEELGLFNNSACLNDTSHDACVWNKNASANVASFNGNWSDYSNSQIVGVKFQKLGISEILKNDEIDVTTTTNKRVKKNQGQPGFLIPFSADNPVDFLQVNAYYWSERTLALFEKQLGTSPLANQNIKVIVNSPLSGWAPNFKEIHLQYRSDENKYMALVGGLVAYHVSQAAISLINKRQELEPHDTVQTCRSLGGELLIGQCCTTKDGCLEAIISGQADFVVALLFPFKTALGEDWSRSQTGIKNCGIPRDPSANSNLTTEQAYGACGDRMISGFAPALGTVYASFWYQLLQQSPNRAPVEKLFFQHLADVKASDTFKTILPRLKAMDQEVNQGALGSLIQKLGDANF